MDTTIRDMYVLTSMYDSSVLSTRVLVTNCKILILFAISIVKPLIVDIIRNIIERVNDIIISIMSNIVNNEAKNRINYR